VIVAVLVPREDAVEALTEHRGQRVDAVVGLGVVQARRHAPGEVPALIELADRQQPGIGRQPPLVSLDNHRQIGEKVEGQLFPLIHSRLRHHRRPPCLELMLLRKSS
jgi:hypothetical protein